MAIQLGGTIYDLEECELCYAPQFGMAKSPANFAGMVGANVLRDDMPIVHWDALADGFLLDLRHPEELAVEQLPGVVNIPVDELRGRLDCVLSADIATVDAILTGKMNAMAAVLRGALEVEGKVVLLTALQRLFPGSEGHVAAPTAGYARRSS